MNVIIKNIVTVIGIISFSGLVKADLTTGLVAYYPFEESSNDKSIYKNNGIPNGNVSYVPGVVGNGLKLNGVNSAGGTVNPDFVRVPNTLSLQFNKQLTVSYWVKFDGDKSQTGANCSGDSVNGIFGAILGKRGERKGFYISEGDTLTMIGVDQDHSKSTRAGNLLSSLGRFRFVTHTVNDNLINIYIDGKLKTSETRIFDFNKSNNEDLYIGVQENSQNSCLKYWYPLDGVIDELRIYNRVLLESEILELYNVGSSSLPDITSSCRATYSNGKLHIPFVDVLDPFTGSKTSTYNVDMQLLENRTPLTFELRKAVQQ